MRFSVNRILKMSFFNKLKLYIDYSYALSYNKKNQFIFLLDNCFLERILFLVLIRLCNNLNENNIHSNQISPK